MTKKTFLHNKVLLQNNEYHLYGKCVVMALLRGSLSPLVFFPVRKKLEELEPITNPEMSVQEASFNFPVRLSAGYCKLVVNGKDKEELIRYVYYAVSCCQVELGQFIESLKLHGILNLFEHILIKQRECYKAI